MISPAETTLPPVRGLDDRFRRTLEVPGVLADGQNVQDTMRIGRAAINHVRTKGPAILQVHTFRFNGHSPADPEHERNRKDEKRWARAACDPIKIFEESADATRVDMAACTAQAKDTVQKALQFANASPPPPMDLAGQIEKSPAARLTSTASGFCSGSSVHSRYRTATSATNSFCSTWSARRACDQKFQRAVRRRGVS